MYGLYYVVQYSWLDILSSFAAHEGQDAIGLCQDGKIKMRGRAFRRRENECIVYCVTQYGQSGDTARQASSEAEYSSSIINRRPTVNNKRMITTRLASGLAAVQRLKVATRQAFCQVFWRKFSIILITHVFQQCHDSYNMLDGMS